MVMDSDFSCSHCDNMLMTNGNKSWRLQDKHLMWSDGQQEYCEQVGQSTDTTLILCFTCNSLK